MPNWLDVTNGWVAIPLQIVGFGIALWQLGKTKTAAEAARDAAERTEQKVGSNLLLAILPQLVQVETNLEWAIAKKDREAAIHYLGSWRWQVGQARGLLAPQADLNVELLTGMQTSIATAADTKLALQDPDADILKRCRSAQKSIAVVTGMVGELTAKQTVEGNTQDGNV